MSFGNKVLGFGAFPTRGDYEIDQSLVFDSAGGPYLHRTPGSASNQRTWTFSAWIKGNFTDSYVFGAYDNSSGNDANYGLIWFEGNALNYQGWSTKYRVTNRVLRDPAAWYHIIVAQDTTDSTADDRVKIYINGVQQTSFSTANNPSQDADLAFNKANQHRVGSINISGATSFAGLMAEVHFVDGSQLTPSDFGETHAVTGQWVPKKYTGSYGTNGFYLKFVSGALGTDSSGEGNNYTAVNLDNYDSVPDTPTNNFCTGNPLVYRAGVTKPTFTQGNLKLAFASAGGSATKIGGTIPVTSGKWYFEVYVTDLVTYLIIGIADLSWFEGTPNSLIGYTYDGSLVRYGTTTSSESSYTDGDIIGIAYDLDGSTMKCYKNGTLEGTISGTWSNTSMPVPAVQGNTSDVVFWSFGQNPTFNNSTTAGGYSDGNGVGNFKYAVPSGYLALCSANLPAPTITKPTDHFNTILYTGNDTDDRTLTGVGFQPDWVWIKTRNATNYHNLFDAVRGVSRVIYSNNTDAEVVTSDPNNSLVAFTSDGFTVDDSSAYTDLNSSSHTYVAWNWKANGSGSTNDDGATDSTVSVNTTAGFSIVTFTMPSSGQTTYGHGLGAVPDCIIARPRGSTGNWSVWVKPPMDSTDDYLQLNTTAAQGSYSTVWGAAVPTSSVFGATVGGLVPASTTGVAYCFAEVAGYSRFGTYKGNGSADGPFVYTGFKPAWVVMKRTDDTSSWEVLDNKRQAYAGNKRYLDLDLNLAATENATNGTALDFLSNGFKHRDGVSTGTKNVDGATYLYIAFAEFPFKYSNAR